MAIKRTWACTAWLLVVSCAPLPSLEEGVCGNGVIEEDIGEQCDMSEDEAFGGDVRCGDPTGGLRACRYICTPGDPTLVPHCPEAWACGEGGVCHFPSGHYEETDGSPLDLPTYSRLDLQDIDGDGTKDIVTSAPHGISVHFARRDGSFATSFDFNVQHLARAISFGDLDQDDRTDIVASTYRGPVVLRGRRDRTLDPVVYSQIRPGDDPDEPLAPQGKLVNVKLAAMTADVSACALGGGDHTIVAIIAYERGLALFFPYVNVGAAAREYSGADQIPTRVHIADLDEDRSDEIILAMPGSRAIRIFNLACHPAPAPGDPWIAEVVEWNEVPLPSALVRFGPDAVDTPDNLIVTDVNGDGLHDIMAAVADERGYVNARVAVAYGLPNHTFTNATIDPRFETTLGGVAPSRPGDMPAPVGSGERFGEWPLAAGDIDRDNSADFVHASGIYLSVTSSQGASALVPHAKPRRLPSWTGAVIEDLDGDRFPDVAAVSDSAEIVGVELYTSRGAGGLSIAGSTSSQLITTVGIPGVLRTGDFDGDRIHDLVFLESGLLLDASISVLYGGSFTRVGMGAPGQVTSIEPADFTRGTGAEDVMLVLFEGSESGTGEPELAIGILFGTEERRLVSPVPIFDNSLTTDPTMNPFAYDPPRVLVGNFAKGDATLDLFAFNDSAFFVLPGHGGATFGTVEDPGGALYTLNEIVPGYLALSTSCVHFSAAEVDPVSPDHELIIVAEPNCLIQLTPERTGNEGGESAVPPPPDLIGAAQLLIAGGADERGYPRVAHVPLPSTVISITRAFNADLDKNGVQDLIVAHAGEFYEGFNAGRDPSGNPLMAASGGFIVYWNVHVDFAVPAGSTPEIAFAAQTVVPSVIEGAVPASIAALNVDGDMALELAVLLLESKSAGASTAKLLVYDLVSPTEVNLLRDQTNPVLDEDLSSLARPEIAAADVDRDGLEDLIFGDGAQVFVYRALAHSGAPRGVR